MTDLLGTLLLAGEERQYLQVSLIPFFFQSVFVIANLIRILKIDLTIIAEDGELILFGVFGDSGVSVKTSSKTFTSAKVLGVSCGTDCVAFYTERNEVSHSTCQQISI